MSFDNVLDNPFTNLNLINCNRNRHSEEILYILNDAIINSTALYDYQPRAMGSMSKWFDIKEHNNFPVIGIVNDKDQLLGFATWGTFRGRLRKRKIKHAKPVAAVAMA